MKNVFIVLVFAVLGWFFIVQKQHDEKPAGSPAAAHQSPPRQVSEHNWMKHSLDTTNKVRQQVAQQRKEDGTR